MPRQIAVEEAFSIIQNVYAAFGWEPNAATTREQRNQMLASAVAVVHYGHATLNPAGGDPRWCLKNAGGGRPQSDDVIVLSPTRQYWDIIGSSGASNWGWSLSGHSEPLPAEQQVYPPSERDLPGGTPVPGPDPGPGPGPEPGPTPPSETERLILMSLGQLHAKCDQILTNQAALAKQQSEDTETIGRWMVEQAKGVVDSVVGQLGPKIDALDDAGCVLKRR